MSLIFFLAKLDSNQDGGLIGENVSIQYEARTERSCS